MSYLPLNIWTQWESMINVNVLRDIISVHIFCTLSALFSIVAPHVSIAQNLTPTIKLALPVEGQLGKDFWIINYVDHNVTVGAIRDYQCGMQTYDGHQGTDFALRSFRQMDSGVYAIAAAPGKVVAVVDSLYDRNKYVDRAKGYGNYVAVEHAEGCITYYAHLRESSVRVRIGDAVNTGQRLGLIGSSGTSEDPHLHFEVWLNVDPFTGGCASRYVRWEGQPSYESAYTLLDADVSTWPPILDTLRERPPSASMIGKQDTSITFWSLQQHVGNSDRLSVLWRTPDNDVWFSYEAKLDRNSTYYYWWSWIRKPAIAGKWTVEYLRNDSLVATRSFTIQQAVSVDTSQRDVGGCILKNYGDVIRCTVPDPCVLRVYDMMGRHLKSIALDQGSTAHVLDLSQPAMLEIEYAGRVLAKTMYVP